MSQKQRKVNLLHSKDSVNLSVGCYPSHEIEIADVDTAIRATGQGNWRQKLVVSRETVAIGAQKWPGLTIAHQNRDDPRLLSEVDGGSIAFLQHS